MRLGAYQQFARVFPNLFAYATLSINCWSLDLSIFLEIDAASHVLNHVTLSDVNISSSWLLGLQRFPNISVLVFGPHVCIWETRSGPDDRTIRNLALQAQTSGDDSKCHSTHSALGSCDNSTEGAAFSKMRLLVLRDIKNITPRIFTYASWFPSLTILSLEGYHDNFNSPTLEAPELEEMSPGGHYGTRMHADFGQGFNLVKDFESSNYSERDYDSVLRNLSRLAESKAEAMKSEATDHRLSKVGKATKYSENVQQKPVYHLKLKREKWPFYSQIHIPALKCWSRVNPFCTNSSEDEAGIGNPNTSDKHEKAKSFRPSNTASCHSSASFSQPITRPKRSDLVDSPTHSNKKARHTKSNQTMDLSNTLADFGH